MDLFSLFLRLCQVGIVEELNGHRSTASSDCAERVMSTIRCFHFSLKTLGKFNLLLLKCNGQEGALAPITYL
jgi:hypothetical protein